MAECKAYGCNRNKKNSKGKSFFCIPKPNTKEKETIAKQWLHNLGIGHSVSVESFRFGRNSVVCEDHFEPECFQDDMKNRLLGTREFRRLKPGAVPTIFVHKKRKVNDSRERRAKKRVLSKPRFSPTTTPGKVPVFNMDFAALQASFKRYCEIATIDQRYKRTGNSIWDFIDFSNLETVQRCIRDVIANIYQTEPEKVTLLQLVYFKNGRRLTPVEITTENDVFKALSEYPAYTSNSNVPVKLGACFIIDGKSVELRSQSSSVDEPGSQSSPSPVTVVKPEVEESAARASPSPVALQTTTVSPPNIHSSTATSTTTWGSSRSEEEVTSQRSETSSPAVIGQPMVAHQPRNVTTSQGVGVPQIPVPVQQAAQSLQHAVHQSLRPVPVVAQPKVIVKQDQFHVHMLESMNEFRKRETLCDLTLVTQDQIHFKVHKIVLISASPYFRSLQEHNVLKDRHVLADVSADTLSTLLDYMYGQGLTVSGDTLLQTLTASYMLGVHGAIRLCEEFKAKFQPPVQEVTVSCPQQPVQMVGLNPASTTQPATTTGLVNVMQKNRRLRKSTPYPSYAAAIRRLREENIYDEKRYHALRSQSHSLEGPGSPLVKDISLGSSNELDRSRDDDQMSHDTDDASEVSSEPLSLKMHSRENSDDSTNHSERDGGLSLIGRHRKAWRLSTHRAREETVIDAPVQVHVKEEPLDNDHD